MIDFQLQVLLGMYDKAVENAVRETVLPEGIRTEFFSFAENKSDISEHAAAIFITDKSSLVRTASALHKKNLHLVYCGHSNDVKRSVNKLDALWPAGESAEIVKRRFLVLVKNLKNEFDLQMHQHMLSAMIENFPFPAAIFSSEREIVRMNRFFEELTGISEENAKGFHYAEWKENQNFIIREQEICDDYGNISGYFMTLQNIA
jgi:PAS domain-containing protein